MQFNTFTTVFALLLSQISASPPASPAKNSLSTRNGPLTVAIMKYTTFGNHVALVVNTTPAGLSSRFDAVWSSTAKTAFRRDYNTKATNYLDSGLPHSTINVPLQGGLDIDTGFDKVKALFDAATLSDVAIGEDCYAYVENCILALEANAYIAPGAAEGIIAQMRGSTAKLRSRQADVVCPTETVPA